MTYEMSVCSKIVSLAPIINSFKNNKIVSSSWTQEGSLLVSDDLGNVYSMNRDDERRYIVVKSDNEKSQRPLIIAFHDGVVVSNSKPQIIVSFKFQKTYKTI